MKAQVRLALGIYSFVLPVALALSSAVNAQTPAQDDSPVELNRRVQEFDRAGKFKETIPLAEKLAVLSAGQCRIPTSDRQAPGSSRPGERPLERCIRQSRFTLAVSSPRYFQSGNTNEEAIITKVLNMDDRRQRLIPLKIEATEMPVWLYNIVGSTLQSRTH